MCERVASCSVGVRHIYAYMHGDGTGPELDDIGQCALRSRIPLHSTSTMATQDELDNFAHLLPPSWKTQVTAWLQEDTPSFDYGGFVVGEVPREAFLLGKGKTAAVLAGVPFFTEVFTQVGCE